MDGLCQTIARQPPLLPSPIHAWTSLWDASEIITGQGRSPRVTLHVHKEERGDVKWRKVSRLQQCIQFGAFIDQMFAIKYFKSQQF